MHRKKTIHLLSVITTIVFLALPSYADTANVLQPKVLAILKDKNDKKYEVRLAYSLSHGLATYTYDFGQIGSFNKIYRGETFGDGENCPELNSGFTLKTAVVKNTYLFKDLNGDGIKDAELSIIEKNCKTGAFTFIEKLLLSSTDRFLVKTLQQKEKF